MQDPVVVARSSSQSSQPSSSAAMPEPPTKQALPPPAVGAAFGIRLVARMIDTVLVSIVGYVAGVAYGAAHVAGVHTPLGHAGFPLTFVTGALAGLSFHAVCESFAGASPGKLAVGLRVLTLDGDRVPFGRALLRNVAYYVDSIFFGLVAYTSMAKSAPLNLRYGDRWAKTIVVPRAEAEGRVARTALTMLLGLVGGTLLSIAFDALGLALS